MCDPMAELVTCRPSAASMRDPGARAALLGELRARIRRIEGIGGDVTAILPFGVPLVDRSLPEGGLPLGCLHEVTGTAAAATGFCAVLLARIAAHRGPALWIARGRDLYAPGIAAYGLTPDRLIHVRARRDADILWAMEEALRCRRIGGVLGEVGALDLAASRRLQLAAESGGVTGFLLRSDSPRTVVSTTAAVTRWRLASVPSGGASALSGIGAPGIGAVRWHAELYRCRGGRPGAWTLEWRDDRLDLATDGQDASGSDRDLSASVAMADPMPLRTRI